MDQPESMVMVKVGKKTVPAKHVPNCKVCSSPHRRWIEAQLLKGYSYSKIAQGVATFPDDGGHHPKSGSIGGHVKNGHLPLDTDTQRQMIEERAKRIGRSIEDDAYSLVDHVVVNDMILQRGFERMLAGEIEPDVKDLAAAIKARHAIEADLEQGFDIEAYQQALFTYLEIAQEFIPPEAFAEYGKALNENPILRAITAKQDSVEGEVVSEGVESPGDL